MTVRTIAVLGAGHGGCAAAADLTARGYDVQLHARREERLQPLRRAGGIRARGVQNGLFPVAKMTISVAEAVAGADLIMPVVPSVAHSHYARELASLLDGSVPVFLNPGHTGGGLHMAAELRRYGYSGPLNTCETVTLTYIARKEGDAEVGIYSCTRKLGFAALPGCRTDELFGVVHGIYPETVKASSVLETALSNINATFHPPGMVLNLGWIERTCGDFLFYKEGITAGVGAVTKNVDNERLAIARAMNVPARPFLEVFHDAGLTTADARDSGSISRACEESEPNATLKAPPSLDHRYMHEDIGYGLVPFAAFGRLAGVATPTIDGLVHLASLATGIDYSRDGLTLARMELEGMTPVELRRYVETGDRPGRADAGGGERR